MSPSVAFIQRRMPHYREAFFAGLYDHLRERGISLDVIVAAADPNGASVAPDRPPWLSAAGGRRFAIGGRELIWQEVVRATASHDLVITELSPRIVSNLALIARSRVGGPSVGGFGHGRDFTSTRVPGRRSAHALLARSLDWWFAYNDLSKDVVMALGVPAERVTAVNNTIDTRQLSDAVASHRGAGMADLRRALGVGDGPVAIFCASLHPRKRLDFVFDAALRLRGSFPDLNLLLLGDGPCEADVRAFAAAHGWVHYAGRVVGADRAKYFAVADVMMMPGLVGLVIIDSFAARVPLVTTDWPFHSPEIQYLRHGENGWCSSNTLDAYVDAVALLLRDAELRDHLRRGCAEAAERYPMEEMVERFADGILGALGSQGVGSGGRGRLGCHAWEDVGMARDDPTPPSIGRLRRPPAPAYDTRWRQDAASGAAASAEVVVPLVLDAVPARRVVDLGCGLGTWLAEFRRRGVAEIRGVDGPWFDTDALRIPAESFLVADLAKPLPLDERYDLAVSLEVGEHLDASLADGLVASLTRLAPVVLFSAAIPGQPGTHHVNLQWPDYWARRFADQGFAAVDYVRPRVWTNDAVKVFYRQNIAVYVDRSRLTDFPALAECHRATGGALLSLVHPVQYDAVRSRPLVLLRKQVTDRLPVSLVQQARRRARRPARPSST